MKTDSSGKKVAVLETIAPASYAAPKTRSVKPAPAISSSAGGQLKRQRTDGPRFRGVRDPRPVGTPAVILASPRRPPTKDLIALQRRWLLTPASPRRPKSPTTAYGDFEKTVEPVVTSPIGNQPTAGAPVKDARTQTFSPSPCASVVRDADLSSHLTSLSYRYTKGVDITNDEMGYGDRTCELFWQLSTGEDSLKAICRVSQRTKSGRQYLFERPATEDDD